MLKINGIDVYHGDLKALSGVGLNLVDGEVVSVIGSNGAGKSTLLRTISGLHRPRRGTIEFLGEDISQASPFRIVEMGLCHVPEGRQLFPSLTVLENLEMGAQFKETKRLRQDTMAKVFNYFPRLEERIKQKAGTLSGGEQQMVAIGRGLMARPKLMMLDEPSLGLAPLLVSVIFEIIRRISEEGTAILLVEQNVYNALNLSHRGYVLENGHVVMREESRSLLANPHVRTTYLGL